MSWREDITAHLPPPEDEGQVHLKQNIVDELADHLSCAMQRELRKIDDESVARRAVLVRFGSVKRIACRLWFDAMKETIMNQRIAMISNAVLAAACIAVCIIAFLAMRQNNRIAETLIGKMEAMSKEEEATAASSAWAEAKIKVVRGSPEGEPAADFFVDLSGEMFNPGTREELTERTDADGVASFGLVRPGRYTVWIRELDVLSNSREIIFYPGRQERDPIVWPDSPTIPAPVSFTVEIPEHLQQRVGYLHCQFQPLVNDLQELPGVWERYPTDLLLTPEGKVWVFSADDFDKVWENLPDERVRLNQSALDLRNRVAMTSALEYRLEWVSVLLRTTDADEPEVFTRFHWSDAQRQQNADRRLIPRTRVPEPVGEQLYRAQPDDENVWRIELPNWLIAALELKFASEDEPTESDG